MPFRNNLISHLYYGFHHIGFTFSHIRGAVSQPFDTHKKKPCGFFVDSYSPFCSGFFPGSPGPGISIPLNAIFIKIGCAT